MWGPGKLLRVVQSPDFEDTQKYQEIYPRALSVRILEKGHSLPRGALPALLYLIRNSTNMRYVLAHGWWLTITLYHTMPRVRRYITAVPISRQPARSATMHAAVQSLPLD